MVKTAFELRVMGITFGQEELSSVQSDEQHYRDPDFCVLLFTVLF